MLGNGTIISFKFALFLFQFWNKKHDRERACNVLQDPLVLRFIEITFALSIRHKPLCCELFSLIVFSANGATFDIHSSPFFCGAS